MTYPPFAERFSGRPKFLKGLFRQSPFSMRDLYRKIVVALLLVAVMGTVLYLTGFGNKLSLDQVQQHALTLKEYVNAHYIFSVFVFIAAYVAINLWLPGAMILTLIGGYLYETLWGTVYVTTAATLGALAGFGMSRYFVGDWVQRKWHRQLVGFNQHVREQGYVFLILVRMIPIMPYSLINILAGLTKISAGTMAWTAAAGSLPGILICTYAGNQLMTIQTVDDIMAPEVTVACVFLMLFIVSVIIARVIMRRST